MLPASLYRQFGRMGNRIQFENAYFDRRTLLNNLLYAEAVEQQGRFLDRAVDLIWAILEETTWVLPAHNPGQLCTEYGEDIHNVDLFSAATAGLLTLSLHLLGESLNNDLPDHLLTQRIQSEIHRRVLLPISRYDMAWMWSGFLKQPLESMDLFQYTVLPDRLRKRSCNAGGPGKTHPPYAGLFCRPLRRKRRMR